MDLSATNPVLLIASLMVAATAVMTYGPGLVASSRMMVWPT